MCSQFIVTLVADVAADLQGTLADLKAARIAAAARARRIRLHQTAERWIPGHQGLVSASRGSGLLPVVMSTFLQGGTAASLLLCRSTTVS